MVSTYKKVLAEIEEEQMAEWVHAVIREGEEPQKLESRRRPKKLNENKKRK